MRKYSIIIFLILCLGIFLKAQELKHEVTVTLKLIQIYVTDKTGNPITDLKQNEFLIYDNNKLQNITDFERHVLFPSKDKIVSHPEKKDTTPSSSSDGVMNRKFFLFFDLVNNNAKGFQKAQAAALHFIDNDLQPSDEVGVLSYSVLKQLTLHEYLTKDFQAVRNVVKQIGGRGKVGRAENFEAMVWREITSESALDASQAAQPIKKGIPAHLKDPASTELTKSGFDDFAISPDSILSNSRFNREHYKNLIRNMFSKIIGLSKALRYISGHKHIIMFSSGVPYSLIHGLESSNPHSFTSLGMDAILRDEYNEMLRELSNSNTTVFSMNTESLATNMNLPSHQKGEPTLRTISKYTGGKFLGNVQNYSEVIDKVQTFTGSYYVLGYYIDESWDGRYHSIKVEVSRPHCEVFAQKGYFNHKLFSEYNEMEKELHLIDLALSERSLLQTPIHLPMIAVPYSVGSEPVVLLLAQIPGKKIKQSMHQKAEIYFLVFDEKDNIIDVKRKVVNISALKEKEAYYYSLMHISPGLYKFRIVIRDMDTGSGAVGGYSEKIPQALELGLQLFPPLLLTPGKSSLFVRGHVPAKEKNKFPLLDYFPFDPAQYSPMLETIPKDISKIQAVLHCSMRKLTKPLLKFSATLIENSSGQSTTLQLSILSGKKEGEMGTLLTEIKIPEMMPGEYVLVIAVEDTSSKARSQTSTACRFY